MHGRAHLLVGAGLGVALSGGVSLEHAPVIATAAVAALQPDLDHEGSDASWLYTVASPLGALAVGWLAAAQLALGPAAGRLRAELLPRLAAAFPDLAPPLLLPLFALAAVAASFVVALTAVTIAVLCLLRFLRPSRYLKHRGALHWPSLALVLGLAAVGVSELAVGTPIFGLAFAVGWCSHLVADLSTFAGMPLLQPFAEAPEHTHTRTVVFAGIVAREPYACRNFHVTPAWLRWRSGDRGVELPIGAGVLGVSVLATSVNGWLPVLAQLVGRA